MVDATCKNDTKTSHAYEQPLDSNTECSLFSAEGIGNHYDVTTCLERQSL